MAIAETQQSDDALSGWRLELNRQSRYCPMLYSAVSGKFPKTFSKLTHLNHLKNNAARPDLLRLEPIILGVPVFVLLLAFWTFQQQSALDPSAVKLNPGEDIQAAVDKGPEGTIPFRIL